MNIYNLISSAFANAGLNESLYRVSIRAENSLIHVVIRRNNRIMIIDLGILDTTFVSDIVVMEDTLFSPEVSELFMEPLYAVDYVSF